MNVIKLNNAEFQVESYSRNTSFYNEEGTVVSAATCGLITNNLNALNELAATTITSIQILHDDNLIYNLENIDAVIENISESLSDDRVWVYVNIKFTM